MQTEGTFEEKVSITYPSLSKGSRQILSKNQKRFKNSELDEVNVRKHFELFHI